MTWTTLTFAYGSTLTSTKMSQLQANFAAMAAGDSGAPTIDTAGITDAAVTNAKIGSLAISQSQLASSSVGQGQLKKSTQQSSGSVAIGGAVDISLTGGLYSLLAFFSQQVVGSAYYLDFEIIESGAYVTTWRLRNGSSGTAVTYYMQCYYFTASPPYDFGDGEVPLFIYAEIEPSGKIVRVDVAQDPPWIFNGPNKLDPTKLEYARNGKIYRTVPQIIVEHGSLGAAIRSGIKKDIAADRMKTDALVRAEVTMADKLRDMNAIPHPFVSGGAMKPGNRIVLLDPVSPQMERLLTLHEAGDPDYNIPQLLMGGDFTVDNNPIGTRKGPPGVPIHGFQWNLT